LIPSRGNLGRPGFPKLCSEPPQGYENSITLDLRTIHLLVLCRSGTKQSLTIILVLSCIKGLKEWSRKQVRKEEVVRVRKCSYNSLMHVQRKASVRYAYCQKGMKERLRAQCRFPAHVHPIGFVPFHLVPKPHKGHHQ
jgi:hypothetical protein